MLNRGGHPLFVDGWYWNPHLEHLIAQVNFIGSIGVAGLFTGQLDNVHPLDT